MKYRRIFLIGFRTTGKSSIGKLLADNLGLSFFDMDFLIKEQAGMEFDKLTKNGTDWVEFRKIEQEVLEELLTVPDAVISCGGGLGVNDIIDTKTKKTFGQLNTKALKKSKDSLVVLLTARDEVVEKRLDTMFRKRKIMPLIGNTKKVNSVDDQIKDSMKSLEKRKKLYQEIADFEIETSDFELPAQLDNLNVVIGDPVFYSLSPKLHFAGYKAKNIYKSNLLIPVRVKSENLEKFVDAVKTIGINGISVTVPHKENIMKYVDNIDETAMKIGAVNTIVNNQGVLSGFNTDWVGAIVALEKKTDLKGKKVAVLGAGGASRAIVYGLIKKKAKVKIFNRFVEKGEKLAKEFGCTFGEMGEIGEIRDFDVIVNATSVGMNEDKSPLDKKFINKNHIILDAVYSPKETRLLKDAKEKGATIVYGYEMLLYQGVEQFKMYTGLDAPVDSMKKFLEEKS